MQKHWIVLIVIVFLAATSFASENFVKAKHSAIAERDQVIEGKLDEINIYLHQAAKDRIISPYEMLVFRFLYQDLKRKAVFFQKSLAVYGVKAKNYGGEYAVPLDQYFSHHFHRRDDGHQVRKFFAGYTGKDVLVEESWYFGWDTLFLILCIVLFLGMGIYLCKKPLKNRIGEKILIGLLFVLAAVLIVGLLAG